MTDPRQIVSLVMGWAAFVLAVLAVLTLFKVGIPISIRATASELALVACALALCKIP